MSIDESTKVREHLLSMPKKIKKPELREARLSTLQMESAVPKLNRRIADLDAFDANAARAQAARFDRPIFKRNIAALIEPRQLTNSSQPQSPLF